MEGKKIKNTIKLYQVSENMFVEIEESVHDRIRYVDMWIYDKFEEKKSFKASIPKAEIEKCYPKEKYGDPLVPVIYELVETRTNLDPDEVSVKKVKSKFWTYQMTDNIWVEIAETEYDFEEVYMVWIFVKDSMFKMRWSDESKRDIKKADLESELLLMAKCAAFEFGNFDEILEAWHGVKES